MKEIIIGRTNSGKTTFIKQKIIKLLGDRFAIIDFCNEYTSFKGHGYLAVIDYSQDTFPDCATRILGTFRRCKNGTVVVDGMDFILLGMDHSQNQNNKDLRVDLVVALQKASWLLSFTGAQCIPTEVFDLAEKVYIYEGTDKIDCLPEKHYNKIVTLSSHTNSNA